MTMVHIRKSDDDLEDKYFGWDINVPAKFGKPIKAWRVEYKAHVQCEKGMYICKLPWRSKEEYMERTRAYEKAVQRLNNKA